MKKFFVLFGLAVLTFCSAVVSAVAAEESIHGTWMPAHAWVTWNPVMVQAQVSNPTFYPLYCFGYAYGQTYSGMVLTSHHGNGFVVPAGQYVYLYVYTNSLDPFVRGWANVQCRY